MHDIAYLCLVATLWLAFMLSLDFDGRRGWQQLRDTWRRWKLRRQSKAAAAAPTLPSGHLAGSYTTTGSGSSRMPKRS